jgi:hypothetical protein
MDADDAQLLRPGIRELVRRVGRPYHDLTPVSLDSLVADPERDVTLEHDEDL